MEENKVVLTLEKYLEMHDELRDLKERGRSIALIILNNCELEKGKLKIDSYDLKYSKILDEIETLFPEDYKKTIQTLKEEKEEE